MDFLKAIEVGGPPSAAEGLDLNAMGLWFLLERPDPN
jgi:hypothetical protein